MLQDNTEKWICQSARVAIRNTIAIDLAEGVRNYLSYTQTREAKLSDESFSSIVTEFLVGVVKL